MPKSSKQKNRNRNKNKKKGGKKKSGGGGGHHHHHHQNQKKKQTNANQNQNQKNQNQKQKQTKGRNAGLKSIDPKTMQMKIHSKIDEMYAQHTHEHPQYSNFFAMITKHNRLQMELILDHAIPDFSKTFSEKIIKQCVSMHNRDINTFSSFFLHITHTIHNTYHIIHNTCMQCMHYKKNKNMYICVKL